MTTLLVFVYVALSMASPTPSLDFGGNLATRTRGPNLIKDSGFEHPDLHAWTYGNSASRLISPNAASGTGYAQLRISSDGDQTPYVAQPIKFNETAEYTLEFDYAVSGVSGQPDCRIRARAGRNSEFIQLPNSLKDKRYQKYSTAIQINGRPRAQTVSLALECFQTGQTIVYIDNVHLRLGS